MIITPNLKDDILNGLISRSESMNHSIGFQKESENYSVPEDVYLAILRQFDKRGFIKLQEYDDSGYVSISAGAHDYILAGGHKAEFEILELQIDKLKAEVYSLEKTLDHQKFEKLKGIVDSIVAFWSTLLISK